MRPRRSCVIELHGFFADAFTVAELDHLVFELPGGDALARQLPVGGALADRARELASLLYRHGRIDQDLFDALAAARPARVVDVEALRQCCTATPPLAPAPRPAVLDRAVAILDLERRAWADGGYQERVHACPAGTPEGTERLITDRLERLDFIAQAYPDPATRFDNSLLNHRCLYGDALRWFVLSNLPLPTELRE